MGTKRRIFGNLQGRPVSDSPIGMEVKAGKFPSLLASFESMMYARPYEATPRIICQKRVIVCVFDSGQRVRTLDKGKPVAAQSSTDFIAEPPLYVAHESSKGALGPTPLVDQAPHTS